MYHIKADKRSRRSAELIAKSLVRMGKAPSDVDVTALAKDAGVGRSTFYRLFDNISDVVRWKCDGFMEEALSMASGEKGFDNVFLSFIGAWTGHSDFMAFIINSSLPEILMETHLGHSGKIKEVLFKRQDLSDDDARFLSLLLSSMLIGAFRFYENRQLPPPAEILSYVRPSLGTLTDMFSVKDGTQMP